MNPTILAVWRPWSVGEIQALRNPARQYRLGQPVEIRTLAEIERLTTSRTLVSLELDRKAVPLTKFTHPIGPTLYLVGPLNGSLPLEVLDRGQIVQVETAAPSYPLRPEIAAGIVLHDRHVSRMGLVAA